MEPPIGFTSLEVDNIVFAECLNGDAPLFFDKMNAENLFTT